MTGNVARLITVQVNPESCEGGRHVYVTSKEVPGLYMMGSSFNSMRDRIAKAVTELFQLNLQLDVRVFWITEDKEIVRQTEATQPVAKPVSKTAGKAPSRRIAKSTYQMAVVRREAA
jgi:hypothetical protein